MIAVKTVHGESESVMVNKDEQFFIIIHLNKCN
jgi:hypothetical protein